MPRYIFVTAVLSITGLFLTGCPKQNQDIQAGRKAEALEDYDTALMYYQRALNSHPTDAEVKILATSMRAKDSQFHAESGEKALKKGDAQLALAEFERAETIDASNSAAGQEIKNTMALIASNTGNASSGDDPTLSEEEGLRAVPPILVSVSREPINLKMTNDARVVFETIAKLAGVSVVFDPDFTSRRISVELPDVTLEQALDAISLESKAFWKPLGTSVIFVAPDNPQKRRDVEDEELRTFYLSNTLTPQDLTEIVTGLRQLLDLRRVQQINAQNAILVRDTPDKLAIAAQIIRDIDKAKPEVLIHVQVLSANSQRLRDIGINPGTSVALTFNPQCGVQPNSSTSSSGCTTNSSSSSVTSTSSVPSITLNNLKNLSTADYSLTLPGAVANAILTDNNTQVIQDPELRVSDGEKASLKIGTRQPVATGSFQAGVGVGVGGGAGVVNPLVNTQFQYIDVGVNIEVTPRVHPDDSISMKLTVDVSSIASYSNIGGINQPVIAQHKIEHDIRLNNGEVSILGGLIERDLATSVQGVPGLAQIPLLRYLSSDNSKQTTDQELLIVLTPHIIRFPSITSDDMRAIAAGTDTNVRVYRQSEAASSSKEQQPAAITPSKANLQATAAPIAKIQFEPENVSLKPGDKAALTLSASNVKDLYAFPILIHFNPAIVQLDDIHDGGFLSGGSQELAIVQRIDEEKGTALVSVTRQPGTPGVSGGGAILGLAIRAVANGTSDIQIVQIDARDSQQNRLPFISGVATVHVQEP